MKEKIHLLMMTLKYPLYKNSIFLIASTFLGAGTGFVFWIVAARLYSTEDLGLASAIISAANLIAILSTLGFNVTLVRFIHHIERKSDLINTCMTVVTLTAFVFSLIFLFGLDIWSPPLTIIKKNLFILTLFIIFSIMLPNVNIHRMGVFVGLRKAEYSFIQTIFVFVRIIILPFLVTLGAVGIFISYSVTPILAYIVGIYLLYKIYNYKPIFMIDKDILKKIVSYSFGNYIAGIFAMLPSYALPILVVNSLGAKANAYFYVAWTISFLLVTISENISSSLLAEGSYNQQELFKIAQKALKFSLLLLIPLIIFIYFFGNYILLIFGRQYETNSFNVLRILIIASIPYSVNCIYAAIKRVKKEIRSIVFIYGSISLLTLILSYILIQKLELIGIGIAWILANSIMSGLLYIKHKIL